jgi:hypothetical protein
MLDGVFNQWLQQALRHQDVQDLRRNVECHREAVAKPDLFYL